MLLPTAIIADPDPMTQQQLVTLLQPGFRCLVTRNLRETLLMTLREQPALLILEVDQPDGDGLALVQYLQADEVLKQILITCVTRRATIKDKIAAFRVGVDDYLIKPLTPQQNFYGRMLLLKRAGHMARIRH